MTKVGIKDIAAKAGVSIATVSHSFRNPGRVSDATREKVLAVAAEAGYSPDRLAAGLRTAKSGNIVVIIPDIADSMNGGIINAIETVARSRGYSVLLGNTQGSEQREREFAMMARSRHADGVILMSHRVPFDLDEGGNSKIDLPPLVNGCEFTGNPMFPTISINDEQAGRDAADHLIEYGHKSIAVITGDIESTSSKERLNGFRLAMKDAGLTVNENLVIFGQYTLKSGESSTEGLLRKKNRPTAIFCFSDEIALGCQYALQRNGFQVPDDMSIIGFDDIPFAKYFSPPLTTISQPTEQIGAACATTLLDLIDGKQPEQQRQFMPHELVIRESTQRLK